MTLTYELTSCKVSDNHHKIGVTERTLTFSQFVGFDFPYVEVNRLVYAVADRLIIN